MVHTQNPQTQPGPIAPAMLLGAGFALIVISFLVFGVDNPNPDWGKFWMIRPLIVTPLAGAAGGAVYYYLNRMRVQGQLNASLSVILGVLIYIVGLWMGVILGLNGTLWN